MGGVGGSEGDGATGVEVESCEDGSGMGAVEPGGRPGAEGAGVAVGAGGCESGGLCGWVTN